MMFVKLRVKNDHNAPTATGSEKTSLVVVQELIL